jgi:hypothetical protein
MTSSKPPGTIEWEECLKELTMLLPKGKTLWEDLDGSFVNLDQLLLFLKKREFTGYMKISMPGKGCAVFLQEGDVVCGVEKAGDQRRSGQGTIKLILDYSRQVPGVKITVEETTSEAVGAFADIFRFPVKLLHKDLSSEFSDLRMFIAKLKSDGFSGYIEVRTPTGDNQGIIFIDNGQLSVIATQESQLRLTESNLKHLDLIIQKISEQAKRKGALFDLFGRADAAS